MNNNDAVFEFLVNQLRQQVTSSSYKKQYEDLVLEALTLDTQLHDALAEIAKLKKENTYLKSEVNWFSNKYISEQSGCRKEDTQECDHEWVADADDESYFVCRKCGASS